MTLDQVVALSLIQDLPRVGLTARLLADDPELIEVADSLLDRARRERADAAGKGIHVLAWNDPRTSSRVAGRKVKSITLMVAVARFVQYC